MGDRHHASHTTARALAILLALPAPTTAQVSHGVFVGINDYIAFEDEPGGDLQGAESDAQLMRDVLVELWGLPEANTRTLLSREATKDAIQASITDFLAEEAGPNDVSIFFFAGHGAQAFDLDGDEPDGLDETLAPSDVLRASTERDIRDDELRAWLSAIPGRVVVILDSCHSGTATRGAGPMRARILDREIPSEGGREPERVRQRYDPESMADGSTTVIEVAAAGPNQSAMEGEFFDADGGREQRGAFTYHLVRALREASGSATYEDVVNRVIANLKADLLIQDPQLTGPKSEPLFGGNRSKAIAAPVVAGEAGGVLVGVPRPTLVVNVGDMPASPLLRALEGAFLPRAQTGRPVDFETGELAGSHVYIRPTEDGGAIQLLGRDGGIRASVLRSGDALGGVLAALDHELLTRRLGVLTNLAKPFAVELALSRGRRTLSLGETIVVEVVTDQAGYLTLVDLAPTGTLTVLRSEEATGHLPAGLRRSVTVAGSGSEEHASGFGLVLALITPTPLEIDPARADRLASSPGLDVVRQLLDSLDDVIQQDGTHANWSGRLLSYEVGPDR